MFEFKDNAITCDCVKHSNKFCCKKFEKTVDCFEMGFDKKGVAVLKPTGEKKNIYEDIQQYKDSCLLENIIKACSPQEIVKMSADYGAYGVRAPQTLAEAQEQIQELNNYFDKLPLEERQKFGCDFNRFLRSDITQYQDVPAPVKDVPAPVKEDLEELKKELERGDNYNG